jgi:hypothetical protein
MDITLHKVTVRELVKDYKDNNDGGVVGFNGQLNIRPPYQREFVYNDKQREAVIDTLTRKFPLNTMYWAVTPEGFEVIDGQQRTISICQYIDGVFSYKDRYFHNLQPNEKVDIMSYTLTVYQCQGEPSEKLDWFKTINIAGEKLTDQELRNAVFAGPWTADAKRYFSKNQCAAWRLADKYMSGTPIRQDYLEAVISWISGGQILDYMGKHQHDDDAKAIWKYFESVISWVISTFPEPRGEMKGISWGRLYNQYKDEIYDPKALEIEIVKLMADEDVTKNKGVYEYLLTRNEKYLNIRAFTTGQKRKLYERQKGICVACNEHFDIKMMEADHVTPWSQGGRTELPNGQMLCRDCNRRKSDI